MVPVDNTRDTLVKLRNRYDQLVMERFHAMCAASRFRDLQKTWLKRRRKRKPFASMEGWVADETSWRTEDSESWWALQLDVARLSEAYGLAPWQVLWALFVDGFTPRSPGAKRDVDHRDPDNAGHLFVLDAWYPQARLVVSRPCAELLNKLVTQGQGAGMYVELNASSVEEPSLSHGDFRRFHVSVELPVEYPPELAIADVRHWRMVGQELVRQVGIDVPRRIRSGGSGSRISVALVTHSERAPFVENLQTVCRDRGLALQIEPGQPSIAPTDEPGKTALALVRLRVEFPLDIRSEDLVVAVRKAIRESREALGEAGLYLGQRLRGAPLVDRAQELRVSGGRLQKRGIGDLIDDNYKVGTVHQGDPSPKNKILRQKVKSQRNQVKRRFKRKGLLPPG